MYMPFNQKFFILLAGTWFLTTTSLQSEPFPEVDSEKPNSEKSPIKKRLAIKKRSSIKKKKLSFWQKHGTYCVAVGTVIGGIIAAYHIYTLKQEVKVLKVNNTANSYNIANIYSYLSKNIILKYTAVGTGESTWQDHNDKWVLDQLGRLIGDPEKHASFIVQSDAKIPTLPNEIKNDNGHLYMLGLNLATFPRPKPQNNT